MEKRQQYYLIKQFLQRDRIMELVSVIVPVYNKEKYILKCLKSISSQTYPMLQIIIVNDGSSDRSGDICEEWAKKDCRIKVIHKENEGLAAARNLGIKYAEGTYICFVDSDDWIDSKFVETLLNACKEENVQIACCKIVRENIMNPNNKENTITSFSPPQVLDLQESIKNICLNPFYNMYVCNKLFSKAVLHNIKFPVGKLYEDTIVTFLSVYRCDHVAFINCPYYHYLIDAQGITQSKFSQKDYDILDAWKQVYDIYKGNSKLDIKVIDAAFCAAYLLLYNKLAKCTNEKIFYKRDILLIKLFLKNNIVKIVKNQYISLKFKGAALVGAISFRFYKLLYRMFY